MTKRISLLRSVAAGRISESEAAAQLGVSQDQLGQWLDVLSMGRELDKQRNRKLLRAAMPVVLLGAVVALWSAKPAWAQVVCAQTLPAPLVTFCPNAPAVAADVNGNFSGVAGWIAAKTGPVSSLDITTRDVSGRTFVSSGTVGFGAVTRQMINLWNTDYGIGVQNNGTYFRSASNYAWYTGGVHSNSTNDPGLGGTSQLTLDGNGNLTARGQLAGASIRQNNCAWGATGPSTSSDNQFHNIFCPAGKYMAGWRCYADASLNGDCAAYCCTP